MKHDDFVIFYADDDADDRDMFTEVIDELNGSSSVFMHESGDNLLHALNNPPPQPGIIFLDLNMPGKTGFEVLKEIRTTDKLKDLPVVVVSTSSDERSIEMTKQLGASYYIPKPSDYGTLKKSINHVLNINWTDFKPGPKDFVYRNN